ncbi:uncharacterized protein LOC134655779 [Cydia amplana]|uniref:uncharacterized protein LOC134655779 n=1 Tax=Cydia amplana TaxID=1869771 RepID=UPI002FE64B7A
MAAESGDVTSESQGSRTRYCAVYDCTHKYKTHPQLAYFGFPSDKERIKLWAEKIRRPDIIQADGRVSGYYRVCEVHFNPRHVNATGKRQRRRLQKRAVPMLRLPHPGPYVHVADLIAVPTKFQVKGKTLVKSTLEVCEYVGEAPKQKTKKKQKVPQPPKLVSLPALEGLFSDCDRHLAPNTAEFVKLVARMQAVQDNDICIEFLHSNPQAYRLLQDSLGLPSVRALHRHCAPQLPDFNTAVELLKTRADQMTELEKHCTLSVQFLDARELLYYNITFDRIVGLHEVDGIQRPLVATRGVVVTARGLLKNWTQPVALCYLAKDDEPFNPWIDKIINRLHTIGLKVHALVCDPTTPAIREVSPEQPFFFVGDTKIYLLYDPPRLMKKLLCEFMVYDFHFDKTIAKWSDILLYRKIERNKALTLTPSLTDASMKSLTMHVIKPQRAAHLLSPALATALTDRAEQGHLSDSARATANFIIKINNLYDLLNSTTMKTSSEFKKGLSQDSNQVGFLTYMKTFFKTLKLEQSSFFDKVATKKLSDSWRVTIEAVLALQKDLQPVRPYLLTRNLHLDDSVAEKARLTVRSGFPSCQQIFSAFKKRFFHEMLQSSETRSVDLNDLLARVVGGAANGHQSDPMEIHDDIPVRPTDYRHLQLPKTYSLMSVAKHLLRAASRIHGNCALSVEYLNAPPEPDFLQLVENLDETLTSALREGVGASRLLRELLLDVHVLDCALPCACFPLDYLKRLFFRLRLYGILRHNQKHFKSGDTDLQINNLE